MATPSGKKYSFIQPIRYYKANDPYYYEIDNLPLRQLEENILYIKGLLEGGTGTGGGGTGYSYLTTNSEIDINNIKQLRPKATGSDRTVSVNAGRFVSRVNDAFDIQYPFNKLVKLNGETEPNLGVVSVQQIPHTLTYNRDDVWDAFILGATNPKPLNMNGLTHTFTMHSSPGKGNSWAVGTGQVPGGTANGAGDFYPYYIGPNAPMNRWWPKVGSGNTFANQLGAFFFAAGTQAGSDYAAEDLNDLHMSFVQMWRGVFRTSVVDFPDVSIQIPEWNEFDYRWQDKNTQVNTAITGADQRIDLLVAYSLPIDQQSTTISDYTENYESGPTTPKTLTVPTLGLVKGAGIGIQKTTHTFNDIEAIDQSNDPTTDAGSPKIIGNVGDKDPNSNQGIRDSEGNVIHGSFPSPDDLLNLAPLLALDVNSDDLTLIGQAALPLAYIVVHKGQTNITQNDIIDIRPFLRTTEFTYNERAGVAAANPPLSLANPAVGAWQLQQVINTQTESFTGGENKSGKALYTDYVMGGLAFGVEGTLMTMRDGTQQDDLDPFGAQTIQQTDYVAGDGISYSFATYSSSKAYLEDTSVERRQAFLEYIYNVRQAHLKTWLANPNKQYNNNLGSTYLGLPNSANGGRNIPLYPEWDMPMGSSQQYNTVVGNNTNTPSLDSPQCTWWMWFEAVNSNRTLTYVPGGVVSNTTANTVNYLTQSYGFGYGDTPGTGAGQISSAALSVVTKELKIKFPSWVVDYDILVEYVNCSPVSDSNNGGNESDRYQGGPTGVNQSVGLGGGVYVNKGTLIDIQGSKEATFRINSASNPLPEGRDGMISAGGTGTTGGGKIADVQHPSGQNNAINRMSLIGNDQLWQYLSYAVCLPGYIQTHYNAEAQQAGTTVTTRLMPKFGAAYYPTVKFTIIAYDSLSVNRNQTYNSTNNWTLIQNPTNGTINRLLSPAGSNSAAPFQTSPSVVNITGV